MASTKPTQAIINPLVSNEVEFKGLGWGDDMMMINLTVGREPVRLTKEKPSHKVPYIFTPGSNIISYRGTVAKRSGPADIPETHRPAATTIEVGDAPQWFSVQINSELVHWEREGLKAIQVDLYRVGGPHDGEQFAQMLLPTAPQPVYWGFEYNTGDKAAYRWGAAYYYRDGVKKEIQPTSASETILTLPAQP